MGSILSGKKNTTLVWGSFFLTHIHLEVLFISALDSAREIISVLANVKLSDIMRKPIEARDVVQIINNDLSSGNDLSA
jgi:hypothetical protein